MFTYFAHSENPSGVKHDLVQHLQSVAARASEFAAKLGASELGYWAGLWHDIGKFNPIFQSYLMAPKEERRVRGPDHSSAGAVLAARWLECLAFLIAGHHAGLPAPTDLKNRVREKSSSSEVIQAIERAREALSTLEPLQRLQAQIPSFLSTASDGAADGKALESATELFLRMLFSALADADFLDTEAHFQPEHATLREDGSSRDLDQFWQRFESDQRRLSGLRPDRLGQIRHEIYLHCLRAAEAPQGIFSLTVPTGGGKTRSGMAFALRHAQRNGLVRIIVAIPYTSITEQTADVYRGIFGDGVLEHHSAVERASEPTDPVDLDELWSRLASENWNAPIVVTTTVQLFESLFSNRTSACRKLHNVACSVLILDEVQTLPYHLLEPILDVLQQLTDHYRVTTVLCTATQPALTDGPYLKGLRSVREIVPNPAQYFQALKRVEYVDTTAEPWTWAQVADEMRTSSQCMAVVNTKPDAFALLDALDDPAARHLSTQMCGFHRRETLVAVRDSLQRGEPIRLVATQVVEAGVDLDFPLVLRALGPLDRIVQAAGRCNREARLEVGRVVIFQPADGGSPPGAYRAGLDTAGNLLRQGHDLHDPRTYETYFKRLFQVVDLDARGIQRSRQRLEYPTVAQQFRIIEDDHAPAVVYPVWHPQHRRRVDELLSAIRLRRGSPRHLLRALQPYIVGVRSRLVASYIRDGLIQEVVPELWEWLGGYDPVRGLVERARDPEALVV